MNHNESNNLIKKGTSTLITMLKAAYKVLSLFFGSSTILFAGSSFLIAILIPASLMAMFSTFTGGSNDVEPFAENKCVLNLNETKQILEDYYYQETVIADKYINDYL